MIEDIEDTIMDGFGSETCSEVADDGFGSETCSSDENADPLGNIQSLEEHLRRTQSNSEASTRYTYSVCTSNSGEDNLVATICTECATDDLQVVVSLENIPEGKRKRVQMPSWTGSKEARLLSFKKSQRLRDSEIDKVLHIMCTCGDECAHKVTTIDVQHERQKYWELPAERDRTEYMVRKLGVDGVKQIEEHKFLFRYLLNNTQVCGPFFEKAIGASHKKFTDVRGRVIQERFETLARTKKNNSGSRGRRAVEFIKQYALKHGNMQPTIKDTTDPKAKDIHLPHGMRKEDVYISYRASMTADEAAGKALHVSSFYEVWRDSKTGVPQIVCRKHQKFAQCKVCSQLKFRAQRGTPSARGTKTCLSLKSIQVQMNDSREMRKIDTFLKIVLRCI